MTDRNKEKSPGRTILINILKLVLIAIVLYFVYGQFSKHWQEVVAYDWSVNFGLLILSLVVHLIAFTMFSRTWCLIIGTLGYKVKLRHAFKIAYIADLGRYIPGKIWPLFGMAYLARQLGIQEERAVTSWGLAMIFNLPSALLAGGACFLLYPGTFDIDITSTLGRGAYLIGAGILIFSVLLIFLPNKVFILANYFLRKLKRPEIILKIKLTTALKIYSGYIICWLLFGLAFWIFVKAVAGGETIPLVPTMGAFIIAYQIGYLAFFAPGGIGIRELVLNAVLMPYLGPIAAGIAVAARLWNLTAEVLAFVMALLIKLRGHANPNQ